VRSHIRRYSADTQPPNTHFTPSRQPHPRNPAASACTAAAVAAVATGFVAAAVAVAAAATTSAAECSRQQQQPQQQQQQHTRCYSKQCHGLGEAVPCINSPMLLLGLLSTPSLQAHQVSWPLTVVTCTSRLSPWHLLSSSQTPLGRPSQCGPSLVLSNGPRVFCGRQGDLV